jgi:hypothetical protein
MEGPVVGPDHTRLLARRAVEEEQGLAPQPVEDRVHVRLIPIVVLCLGAIASVVVVVVSLL